MVFRAAVPEEAGAILALYRSVLGTPFCVWDEEYPGMTQIREDLATDSLFVLTEGDALVGAISVVPENELDELPFWQCPKPAREFARVVIARDWQGKGLAARLVENIEKVIRSRGAQAVHILVAVGNIPADRTYRKLGYREMGRCFMFGHDYYALEKRLEDIN